MNEKEYLPYKTINVFIERDYLRNILENILKNINQLPKEDQISFGQSFREHVSILGFRNPMRAPLPLKVNAYVRAFEDMDEVIPFTLSTWTKIKRDFAAKVKAWLEAEGWTELKYERDFNETEGFVNEWPDSLSFEDLIKKFENTHSELDYEDDDLLLMTFWISGKLPDEDYRL